MGVNTSGSLSMSSSAKRTAPARVAGSRLTSREATKEEMGMLCSSRRSMLEGVYCRILVTVDRAPSFACEALSFWWGIDMGRGGGYQLPQFPAVSARGAVDACWTWSEV